MATIAVVAVLHVGLGYLLISGLALKAVKVITGPLETINIEEEAPPPEEPPPPPPKELEIPPYVPPPEVTVQTDTPPPPTISVQTQVPAPVAPVFVPAAPAPPAPAPAPPAPTGPTTNATLRSKSMSINNDDYPDASRRAEEQGSTRVTFSITADGRVEACNVAASSGFPRLDEQTCKIILRRWRFNPAQQNGVAVASTKTQSVRWQLSDGR